MTTLDRFDPYPEHEQPRPVVRDYPGTARRTPHFDLAVMGAGIMRRLPTTLFFPGHPANAADQVLRALPEALRDRLLLPEAPPRDGLRRFRAELRLRGARETPFFRD